MLQQAKTRTHAHTRTQRTQPAVTTAIEVVRWPANVTQPAKS